MTASTRPSSSIVMSRVLLWGAVLAGGIAVVAAPLGYAVAGVPGLVGGLLGAAMGLVFMGATALSILVANRFASSDAYPAVFLGVVMGGWLVKLVLFLIVTVLLRDQPWLEPSVLGLTLIVVVVGSLVVDVLVTVKGRMPAVTDLPPSRRID
ncbi:hypothetical protein [Naasia sp. SYSU D00948]|uniref:hypothetical protein n=1 Tax=Naasia sp. SYSU D00948 TaxID=2817379 RepID=UPI001B30C930|nr:hypothetical protein [Naasia sp. SYSU D00948]